MVVPVFEILLLINIESQIFKSNSKERPFEYHTNNNIQICVYGDILSPFSDPILRGKSIFHRDHRKLSHPFKKNVCSHTIQRDCATTHTAVFLKKCVHNKSVRVYCLYRREPWTVYSYAMDKLFMVFKVNSSVGSYALTSCDVYIYFKIRKKLTLLIVSPSEGCVGQATTSLS